MVQRRAQNAGFRLREDKERVRLDFPSNYVFLAVLAIPSVCLQVTGCYLLVALMAGARGDLPLGHVAAIGGFGLVLLLLPTLVQAVALRECIGSHVEVTKRSGELRIRRAFAKKHLSKQQIAQVVLVCYDDWTGWWGELRIRSVWGREVRLGTLFDSAQDPSELRARSAELLELLAGLLGASIEYRVPGRSDLCLPPRPPIHDTSPRGPPTTVR